jgi:hypothetical protein
MPSVSLRKLHLAGAWVRPSAGNHVRSRFTWIRKFLPTNPDNLVLLCRTHHWAVHEGAFRVDGRAPQELVFRRPDGNILPVCPVRLPIRGTAGETLKEVNRRVGLEITTDTVDSVWDGEAMDYHMAVDGLLDCENDSKDDP